MTIHLINETLQSCEVSPWKLDLLMRAYQQQVRIEVDLQLRGWVIPVLILLVAFAWNLHGTPGIAAPDQGQTVSSIQQPGDSHHDDALGVVYCHSAWCQSAGPCSQSAALAPALIFPTPASDEWCLGQASLGQSRNFSAHFRPPRLPPHV